MFANLKVLITHQQLTLLMTKHLIKRLSKKKKIIIFQQCVTKKSYPRKSNLEQLWKFQMFKKQLKRKVQLPFKRKEKLVWFKSGTLYSPKAPKETSSTRNLEQSLLQTISDKFFTKEQSLKKLKLTLNIRVNVFKNQQNMCDSQIQNSIKSYILRTKSNISIS